MAMKAHRNLANAASQQARSMARLSSGFRVNTAADDAAGLSISENMRAQIRGMRQAARNVRDGISFIQTVEGFTQTITELLQRSRELAVQGANDTYNSEQRRDIANEMYHMSREMERIWNTAMFNGQHIFVNSTLLDDTSFMLQIDAKTTNGMAFDVVAAMGSTAIANIESWINDAMGEWGNLDSNATHSDFNAAINTIDEHIRSINLLRANLGAIENRLEFTTRHLYIAAENLAAADSRIRDADMAQEMMRLAQANILQQIATAMLAQANNLPEMVLRLLG